MTPTNHGDEHRELDRFHAEHGHADHDGSYNEDVAHEHSDVNIRAILMFALALSVVAAVVMVAMWGLFEVFEKQAAQNDPIVSPLAMPPGQTPPEPALLLDEPKNLQEVKTAETQVLQGYAWIDQQAGTARMPIDEAKKKLLHDGLPVRLDASGDQTMGTNLPARGESSSGRFITAKPAQAAGQPETPPADAPKPAAPEHKGGGH